MQCISRRNLDFWYWFVWVHKCVLFLLRPTSILPWTSHFHNDFVLFYPISFYCNRSIALFTMQKRTLCPVKGYELQSVLVRSCRTTFWGPVCMFSLGSLARWCNTSTTTRKDLVGNTGAGASSAMHYNLFVERKYNALMSCSSDCHWLCIWIVNNMVNRHNLFIN